TPLSWHHRSIPLSPMGDSLSVTAVTLVCDRRGASQPPEPAPIWQKRFYDFNVRTEQKQTEKLRYIHRNPVKRGLVDCPEQWEWSSFRSYLFGEPGPVRVKS